MSKATSKQPDVRCPRCQKPFSAQTPVILNITDTGEIEAVDPRCNGASDPFDHFPEQFTLDQISLLPNRTVFSADDHQCAQILDSLATRFPDVRKWVDIYKERKNTSTGTVTVGVFPLSLALHIFTFADGFERQEDNGLMWWCASRPTVESIDELAKMLSGHFGGIEATRKQLYAVPGVPELLARVVSIPKSKTPTDGDLSEDINAHNLAFIKKNMLGISSFGWAAYKQHGRGAIVLFRASKDDILMPASYIPQNKLSQIEAGMKDLPDLFADMMASLPRHFSLYDPNTGIVVVVIDDAPESEYPASVYRMRTMPPPPVAYEQMGKTMQEIAIWNGIDWGTVH
jgi:hypothetical protein